MPTPTRQYTKVARARGEEQTREALLDAAEDAYLSDALDQVSLDALAAGAGSTKQTLLRHFGSKDGLPRAAYERGIEHVREQRFAAPVGDVAGAVDNLLDHYGELGDSALKIGAATSSALSAEIGKNARQLHYDWVDHAFSPWLETARGAERRRLRGALIALCDVQTWAILSRDLGYPRALLKATLVSAIESLLRGSK